MNLDIVDILEGRDLVLAKSQIGKAANVLAVQIGSLEYAPTLGVDMRYFMEAEFRIQNESFKSYLVQRLIQHQINVSDVAEVVENLYSDFIFGISNIER